MPCTNADAALAALAANVGSGIAEATVDGVTTRVFPMADLIAAHKYLSGVCAANTRHRGLRFNRLIPDGTVHRRGFAPTPGSGWGFDRWRDV